MKLQLDIQQACSEAVPAENELQNWIETALEHRLEEAEVSLRLVDEDEMNALNLQYRDQDKSTNVLSFPADLPAELQHPLLGDIVICPSVVEREATEQHKAWQQHWTHMLVHGSLHLLGYDHIEAADAAIMETLETTILQSLGWPCPYGEHAAPTTEKSATR